MAYFDVIVLGAGASGLMAAIEAGKRNLKVLLIDHANAVGKKLLVSGGGKCNITNRNISWKDYFGENPAFCKTALQRFRIENTLQILQSAQIDIEEREYGRIFCQQGAKILVDYLANEVCFLEATCLLENPVLAVCKSGNNFEVNTAKGNFTAANVVIATGGLAWPQIGATDIGHKIAKQFGHKIIPAKPALVGFMLDKNSSLLNLQGISLLAEASISKYFCVKEPLLFTHKGISGPAVFQLSCTWEKGDTIVVNFLPDKNVEALMHLPENGKLLVRTLLSRFLPDRLLQAILPEKVASRKVAELGKKERHEIIQSIHAFAEIPTGTEDFSKAETTRGGVSTAQINPKTMESLLVPGLYFAGEVADIAGKLGGYNIHWAFASGFLAGKMLEIRQ